MRPCGSACLRQESFGRGRLTAMSRMFGHGGLGASSRSFDHKEKQSECEGEMGERDRGE